MQRPKILLIPDREGWAFDIRCNALIRHLSSRFDFTKIYFTKMEDMNYKQFDLVYYAGFYMVGSYHDKAWGKVGREKLITSISGLVTKTFIDAVRHLTKVIAYSALNYEFAEWFDGVVEAKMFYIPNGVEPDLFTPGQKLDTGKLIIGWAGKDDHEGKRLDQLKKVVSSLPDVELITQTFSNYISHEEMPKFYQQLDCYCQVSMSEGCSNTMLEAASCGIPIISTDTGVARELIQGDGGIILNDDLVGLREAIVAMKDRGRRQKMSQDLRTRIMNDWTWERRAGQYKEMFEYALGEQQK